MLDYNPGMTSRLRLVSPFAVLVVLCLPVVYPFLGGDLPRTNDLATHVYRAFELEQLLRAGVLFPRWGPQLVHGYGYPIFNYFPYLSHYLISLIHMTSGLDYLWAYRLVSIGATVAAGWGAFLCASDLFSDVSSGLLAAIGFVYSPYLLMTANVRGGLPESLALAALPFAFWAWARAARGERVFVLWGGVAYAVIILSHNGSALQLSPLLLAYALFRGSGRWAFSIGHVAATAALGIGMAAFYWLPALLELGFVQVEAGYASTGIVYHQNFTPLPGLFTYPPLPVDSDLLNPPVSSPLAVVTLGLAFLTLWRAHAAAATGHVREMTYLAVLCLAALFLVLPQSRWIWDALPPLQLTLWPWRFVGPASLLLALLAAGVIPAYAHGRISVLLIGIILLIANGLPWFYPPREPLAAPESASDLARFELPPWLIGTSTTAEYLPRWVQHLPDSDLQRDALLSDPDPDRLMRDRLPNGVTAELVLNQLLHDDYHIVADKSATLTFRHFYFPGWRASLDGIQVPLRVTNPGGLMAVSVPAGEHTLTLLFGSTPARRWAGGLSVATLVLTIVLGFRFSAARPIVQSRRMIMRPVWLLAAAWLSLFLFSAWVENPLRRHGLTPGNHPLTMENVLDIDVGGELWLHGFSLSAAAIPADGQVKLDLYWQAQRRVGLDYGFNVRLRDGNGRLWNTPEIVRPPGWRFMPGTDFWPPDKYVLDNYALRPLPGTPPGEYQLKVVTFRKDTLQPLHTADLGSLHITHPDRTSFAGARPLALLGDEWWTLWDLQVDRAEAAPGDLIGIHAVWGGVGVVTERRNVQISLVKIDGEHEVQFDFHLSPDYPPGRWHPGEALRDQYIFRLPAALPSGEYIWSITLLRPDGSLVGEFKPGNSLNVIAPQRSFSVPDGVESVDVSLGDIVVLSGYMLNRRTVAANDKLALTLFWQASTEIPDSYRVFVHLLDERGGLRAQSDGEPAGWSRPTPGWLLEEYVSDHHALTLPDDLEPASYSLRAGMYHPRSGERLAAAAFPDGSVVIAEITVLSD